MQHCTEQEALTVGWGTTQKKDGSQTLREPFYSTNPMYVAQHKEWDWQECHFAVAEQGVRRQMSEDPTPGDAA